MILEIKLQEKFVHELTAICGRSGVLNFCLPLGPMLTKMKNKIIKNLKIKTVAKRQQEVFWPWLDKCSWYDEWQTSLYQKLTAAD